MDVKAQLHRWSWLWGRVVIYGMIILPIYVGMYVGQVERAVVLEAPDKPISKLRTVSFTKHGTEAPIFAPLHWIDRKLRPEYWAD